MAASATIGLLRVLLTADTAQFQAAMKQASDSAKVWSKDLQSIGQQATTIGRAMTGALTVPIVAGFAATVKAAGDFESSFAGVRKTVEATEPEFAALAKGLRDMALEIPVNVNELNRVAEAAGQLGIKKDDILQFTRTMADLGATTNLTADEAAQATGQFQNIFDAAGKDVDRFGATLVALGNDGASTEKSILEMGLRIAGAGRQVGLSQGEVLAFASALSSVGINAEAGGTAISRVFLKMGDAVAKGGAGLTEFARVAGMSSAEFKTAFETDAAGATAAFISGLGRLKTSGENVNQTIEGLLGKSVQIKDTLNRAAGAGQLLTNALTLQARAWEENTALTEEAAKRYTTFYSELAKVWAQVRDVGITIGTALIPTLRDLVATLKPALTVAGEFAKRFAELPEPIRVTGLAIGGLVAAAPPMLFMFGQMSLGLSAIVGAFKAGGIGATAFGGVVKGLAVLTGPIALVVEAIAGLSVAWAVFKNDWTRAFDVLLPPLGFFRTGLDGLKEGLAPVLPLMRDLGSIISNSLVIGFEVAKRSVSSVIADALKPLVDQVTLTKNAIGAMIPWVQERIPAAFEAMKAGIATAMPGFAVLLALEAKLKKWSGASQASISEVAKTLEETAARMKQSGANLLPSTNLGANAFAPYKSALKDLDTSIRGVGRAAAEADPKLKAFNEALGRFGGRSAIEQGREMERVLTTLGGPLKVLPSQLGQLEGAFTSAAEAARTMGNVKLAEHFEALAQSVQPLLKTTGGLASVFDTWVDAGHGVRVMFSRLPPVIESAGEAIRKLGGSLRDLPSDTSWVADTWVPFRAAVEDAEADVFRLGDSIRSSVGDVLSGIPSTLSRAFEGGGNIAGAFASIGVQLSNAISTSITDGLSAVLSSPQMQRLNAAISGGAAVASGIGGAVGGSTAATVAGLAGTIGGAIIAMSTLGSATALTVGTMATLGATTAGIGLAAVGVFMVAKHFFTVSKAVKEARADVVKFEDAIRDSLTEQQKLEAGGERWAEVLIGVRDAFLATGRSAEEAERLTAQMWDTDNPERARDAIAQIGVVFAQLAEQQRVLAEGTEEATGIFQDLEAQAALMGNTMPDSLRPMIDRLVEMGVVTEETAARLGAIGNEGEVSIDAMKAAAEEFGLSLDTLGPTFQQQRLTEEAQRILTGINLLTKGGTDANVVLDGMQDELQAVVIQSRKLGTEIPENLRPYLQSLVDSNELVDENGNKLTDLSGLKFGPPVADQWQIITDKLSILIDKISAALPKALDNFSTNVDESTGEAVDDFGNVIGKVDSLGNAIRRLPKIDVGDAPNLDVVPSYAIGSGGIRDFGAGQLAMLHGREGVYTEAQIAAIRGTGDDSSGLMSAIRDQTRQLTQAVRSMLDESRYIAKLSTRDAAMGAV